MDTAAELFRADLTLQALTVAAMADGAAQGPAAASREVWSRHQDLIRAIGERATIRPGWLTKETP